MTPKHRTQGSEVTTKGTDDERRIKPFATTLQEIGSGVLAARLAEQLQELTNAVVATGKKGTLTVQLIVAPLKRGNVKNLVTTAKTVLKAPEDDADSPSSVFFVDADGNLTRDDPNQPTLPIRGLDTRKDRTA
jgi:hypothetical protein